MKQSVKCSIQFTSFPKLKSTTSQALCWTLRELQRGKFSQQRGGRHILDLVRRQYRQLDKVKKVFLSNPSKICPPLRSYPSCQSSALAPSAQRSI